MSNLHKVISHLSKVYKMHNLHNYTSLDYIYTLCITSGDENHLCGASLRESHKISSKAHRHAYVHGVGAPIARPEKLPRQ